MQWIYMVDDAWFHPEGLDYEQAKKEFEESNGTSPFNRAVFEARPESFQDWNGFNEICNINEEEESSSSSSDEDEEETTAVVGTGKKPFTDQEIAKFLGDLAVDHDYGICFCSFEHFWTHYDEEINKPYHAVFFDINHALRGLESCSKLNEKWKKELLGAGLFTNAYNNPGLHGWLLHYAMKLGCAKLSRTVIPPSHVLLISSNFMETGSDTDAQDEATKKLTEGKNPATQFGTVSLDIWNTIFSKKDENELGKIDSHACMADFGFSPFQKTAQSTDSKAETLKNGFEFFDRTFSKAAKWDSFRENLIEDMIYLWENHGMGHDAASQQVPALKAAGWIDTPRYFDTIAGTHYLPHDDRNLKICAKSLVAFLKQAFLLPELELPENAENWVLLFPTKPGLACLVGLGDLYDTMCVLKEGRINPIVKLRVKSENEYEWLEVVFEIPSNDAQVLERLMNDRGKAVPTKTSAAIYELNKGILTLEKYIKIKGCSENKCHYPEACNGESCVCPSWGDAITNLSDSYNILKIKADVASNLGQISLSFNREYS